MKIAIFGGGVAGLVAAIHLIDKGYDIELYEKRGVLGGKVSVWKDGDGDSVESGLHIVFGGYKELQATLKKVGAEKNFQWKDLALVYAEKGGRQTTFEKVQGLADLKPMLSLGAINSLWFGDFCRCCCFEMKNIFVRKTTSRTLIGTAEKDVPIIRFNVCGVLYHWHSILLSQMSYRRVRW
jgi:hypothetical protein